MMKIHEFERMLTRNSTRILKFMLNIDLEGRAGRAAARPGGDAGEALEVQSGRPRRMIYMKAYEIALSRCSMPHARRHVVLPIATGGAAMPLVAMTCVVLEKEQDDTIRRPTGSGVLQDHGLS